MATFLSRVISFLSFAISAFIDEAEGVLGDGDTDDEGDADDEVEVVLPVVLATVPLVPEEGDAVEDVEPTVGMATLVPLEVPVVAA